METLGKILTTFVMIIVFAILGAYYLIVVVSVVFINTIKSGIYAVRELCELTVEGLREIWYD